MTYKTPLAVYIIWHPNYLNGQQIADFMYSTLCRNPEKPLVRSLGIPIYFRCIAEKNKSVPKNIDFNESEHTAIIPLISDEFVNNNDYCSYLDSLFDQCNSERNTRRLYPVALSKYAFNASRKLNALNFIPTERRINECGVNTNSSIFEQIRSAVLHELCRLLMSMKRVCEETPSLTVTPPVKLFISHSKHDDAKLDAAKFRDYINSQTQLKTFFDTNDIAYGSEFAEEIKRSASESALVVFQSDSYAEREWCRIEVLTAKSAGCPIVIVNAIQNGERRAFPYLGNCPSIRFKENYQTIIDLTLEQVLFNRYTQKYLDSLTDLYETKTDSILTNTPELFNFIQLKKQTIKGSKKYSLVIYPDPPMGSEEMEILNQLDDDFVFITPLMLPSIERRNEQRS